MSRKDDPVFNVKFVQLVESHPCLWNSSLPAYSKKEETQKAWQEVANETKDTVRSCRERWRTIRSSFLRSLKLSCTLTGRGKRKYYLSKYLQFLIPYTKTRLKNGNNIVAIRRPALQPMTRINNMPMPATSSDDTKDSTTSEVAIAEEDVLVTIQESAHQPRIPAAIKLEQDIPSTEQRRYAINTALTNNPLTEHHAQTQQQLKTMSTLDLTEFAEWMKSKSTNHSRYCCVPTSPDGDQSFLNSLYPYLKEMSGKQNRRFRQKVVALIDAVLDNVD